MHVVISSRQDTAYIKEEDERSDPASCAMDHARCLLEFAQKDMEEIGWRKRKVYISDTASFRFRLKAWTTMSGNRTICLRVRRKRADGSLGMERLVYQRVNGVVVKP